jgi:hypothetical protein
MAQKEANATKAPERRVRRTPIGQRNVLTLSKKDPAFEYRFVNDTGDRIQEFLDNGWEIETNSDISVGDKRLGVPGKEGTPVTASVGQGTKAVVLKIPKELYEEDQAAKQAYVQKTEEAIRGEALDGTYGQLEIGRVSK